MGLPVPTTKPLRRSWAHKAAGWLLGFLGIMLLTSLGYLLIQLLRFGS